MKNLPDHALQEMLDVLLKYSGLLNPDLYNLRDMKTLEAKERNLELLLLSFQRRVRHFNTNLRRHRNTLLPIYRLPPELLAVIFIDVQGSKQDHENPYQVIKRLAGVSYRWFSSVLSIPHLWTEVNDSLHPSLIKSIIRHSKTLPLHIYLERESSTEIFDLLRPHAARWKTAQTLYTNGKQLLSHNMEGTTLSQLESFKAFSRLTDQVGDAVPAILRYKAPRLRELSITPFSFPSVAPAFSTLRKIVFNPVHGGIDISSSRWHSFLTACPQLEHIEAIRNHSTSWRSRNEPFPTFHVHLPKLHIFKLVDLSTLVSGALICSICPGSNVYPHLSITNFRQSENEGGLHALLPRSSQPHSFIQMFHSMTWMSLQGDWRAYNGPITIKAGSISGKAFLEIRTPLEFSDRTVLMETLATLANPQTVEELHLSHSIFEQSDVLRGLSYFPWVKKLSLVHTNRHYVEPNYHDYLADICKSLSSPLIGDNGVQAGWLLPCLNHLIIAGHVTFEQVLPLAEARFISDSSNRNTNLPAKIEVLQLTMLVRHDLESPGPVISSDLVKQLHKILDGQGTELRIDWPVGKDCYTPVIWSIV